MSNVRAFTISIHKKHKSTLYLCLLANFSDVEMTKIWSEKYIYQVCKLNFLFRIYPKIWAIFILIVCYLELLLNIFYHSSIAIVFKTIFWYFFGDCENLLFLTKKFSKSYIFVFFIQNYSRTSSRKSCCRKIYLLLKNENFNIPLIRL